ncbi:FAD-binding protein [Baekduia soli]|uniref:FAD-binding protein n=1 Tax=Baekduia soli TaxID=496014 RepID=A0A5B8UBD5_9ACTN|nr:FAD-binding protein [Baekduia soli]QEC50327.1 FAD-binding protein [Baekduia soli]
MRIRADRPASAADRDATYDAILVGTGLGCLAAAIGLAAAGLRPLLLERAALVGGASAWSGGVVWAPANHRMRAKGLADSAGEALEYLRRVSDGRGDAELAAAYVQRLPAILRWLERETELAWMSYPRLPDYFEIPGAKPDGRCLLPQPRVVSAALEAAARRVSELLLVRPSVHFPAQEHAWAGGRGLVGSLWLRVLQDATPYELDTRARALLTEDGSVAGVEVEGPGGRRRLRARHGVLLGTGGFEWNARMTRAAVPAPAPHPQTPVGATGDGQRMAAALGAGLALMDQTIWTPGVCVPGERDGDHPLCRLCFQELSRSHCIVVNRAGRRFADETFFQDLARGWCTFDASTASHPNLPMHLVFDERHRERHGLPASVPVGDYLTRHPSLTALAAANGIDPAGLEATVRRFNADVAHGRDREFGRGEGAYRRAFAGPASGGANPTLGAISEPPFYCMELFPGTSGHRGGVVCDPSARVLDVDGAPIDGLYACGATAAGLVTGGAYLTGTSLGQALVSGMAAAEAIGARSS